MLPLHTRSICSAGYHCCHPAVQLAAARKKEANAMHAFQMLKLSLEDRIKFDTRDLDDTKADLAASAEKKTVAEGSLAHTLF